MLRFILFILLSILFNQVFNQRLENATRLIEFKAPDLVIEYDTGTETLLLEAFKAKLNDEIIEQNKSEKYNLLKWYSYGSPKLVVLNQNQNNNFLMFGTQGFYCFIEMLNIEYKHEFQKQIEKLLKIQVDLSQIQNFILNSFTCSLNLVDYTSKKNENVTIYGQVGDLRSFPLQIEFTAPIGTRERILVEEIVNENRKNREIELDFNFECEMNFEDKFKRKIHLSKPDTFPLQSVGNKLEKMHKIQLENNFNSLKSTIIQVLSADIKQFENSSLNSINNFTSKVIENLDLFVKMSNNFSISTSINLTNNLKSLDSKLELNVQTQVFTKFRMKLI